ncbi:SDR family NAD(P)-dependent oxidoreductase [Paenibacillus sacheonensis]|uniref:Glucose 1-dehydrogenase n=1 Tax=Paenibacillus sacheonensis TaxID=742054 RepID=A0A7X4YNF1_9BACL|nr:SDR family NAD(P)-dependent oxidoreductase [Paenibacillus sacheonensis]MBM7565563.1 3-oxoacyl-[acyl-carrier protein] reductase [Paenibacillus sacheonensis]NBC69518.1 glucose 1-dehydrogenase [Paenibacillus sacheonensis]
MIIDLKGKVAVVTGAGRGIGREIALTLAHEGVKTVALDIRPELLNELGGLFAERGYEGAQYNCDVRDGSRVLEVVQEVAERFGRIDILVNNAGVASGGTVETLGEDVWDANLDINLKGTFLMCKAVAPVMKAQRQGRILNAASFAAIVPSYGSAAYASSKAAVKQFTRVLAGELGPWDITVNCYSPGMIPTDMNHFAELNEERQQRLLDTLTLRRWGSKADVANLICFLSSDLAAYITGTMIDVSGGKLATQIPAIAYEAASRKDVKPR